MAIQNSNLSNNEKEIAIRGLSKPFNEIGKNVITYITEKHNISDSFFELSNEEIQNINNLNDIDYTHIGLILNYNYLQTNGWSYDEILDCAAVALGIAGIYDLITNTRSLAAYGEAANAKELLKLAGRLGRRFLGWIGVAIFVRDFGKCMNAW
ncbi:MAG: hypothetical protein ACK4K1_03755 [Flavobacterium sp.]